MQISIITQSGATQLDIKSQQVKLQSPFALLEIWLNAGEQCDVSVGKKTIHYNSVVNQFHLDLSPKNSETIKINLNGSIVVLQFVCAGGIAIDERSLENLMHFHNSLTTLPTDTNGQVRVLDLLDAIETGTVTLLRVQKPLSGYDNKSLLDKLESALKQKVRAICSSPKQGIKSEDLVQDVSLVKRINTNTLSHLSSHTEHWKTRTLNGLVPKRLKSDIIEDEINIYENLFFKMAIDDIADYTTKQILAIKEAKRTNKNARDWEAYGSKINDYRRSQLLQKLLSGGDVNTLNQQNKIYDDTLSRWMNISKILVSIRSSAFYRKINRKKRISKTVHLTNILKNDQRYKALYDIWCLVKKEKQKEQQEKKGMSHDLTSMLENYYASYSAVAILYSMNFLGSSFSEDSVFSISQEGRIIIKAKATDENINYVVMNQDNQFGYNSIIIKLIERVDIEIQLPDECIFEADAFDGLENIVTLDESALKLHFHKTPTADEAAILRKLLHTQQSEVLKMNEQQRHIYQKRKDAWNAFLDDVLSTQTLHNPSERTLTVSPVLFDVQADSTVIERFTDEMFLANSEYVCYLFPHTFERYKEINSPKMLRRLFNYGEAFDSSECDTWKNYRVAVLPVTQIDIGSIQRLMKFISIHRSKLIMEIEGQSPKHCPVCGSKLIRSLETNSWKCENCKVEWGETRCTKGCKEFFHWVRPDSTLLKDEFNCSSECELILKKDSLFDKYIITDFEFEPMPDGRLKLYPVCPKCGTRRY